MGKTTILDPAESYIFSKYAELSFDTADILMEFGVTLHNTSLQLPQQLPIDPEPLRSELQENLTLVDPSSEIARREALIFPILKTVCKVIQAPLKIEYPVRSKLSIPFELMLGSKVVLITSFLPLKVCS